MITSFDFLSLGGMVGTWELQKVNCMSRHEKKKKRILTKAAQELC